jgi:hypothetical protein
MVDLGERRILESSFKFDMKTKRISSASFREDWKCLHCGAHGNKPAFKRRGEVGTSSGEQAVVLADQCFPPILPAKGGKKCLKILRVENGCILDLVDEFLKVLGNQPHIPSWLDSAAVITITPWQGWYHGLYK